MRSPTPVLVLRPDAWRALAVLFVVGVLAVARPVAAENPCTECHDEQGAALQSGPHRGVVSEDARFCEACHGNGARHLESGEAADVVGPETLAKWSPADQSRACLTCHGASFPAFDETPHAGRVSCWSCHDDQALHAKAPGDDLPRVVRHQSWGLCTSCHGAVRAELRLQYRHPVEEGLVDCVDCHDVHGANPALDGETSVAAATCVSCHHEQRGPHLFEHLALEEGCTGCHRPHGSFNRGLLASSGNGVCLTCHLQSTFPGVGQIPHDFKLNGGARCWDCHSEVHGSNTTPDFNPRGRR